MFEKIFENLKEFEEHHQVFFALVVVLGVICFSWGVEKILEEYVFPHRPFYGYVFAISLGLFLLWLTKYILLEVM